MDFGLSHILIGTASTIETATGGYRGNIRWQAPELVIESEAENNFHTEASDIWALGMVYFVSDTFIDQTDLTSHHVIHRRR